MTITPKDTSLYALGVGFNLGTSWFDIDPLREEDYKYTNEQTKDFTTLPTISAVMKLKSNLTVL
jgi:hypothetical protein